MPKDQGIIKEYKPWIYEPFPGITIKTYEPYYIDLSHYLCESETQMQVIEVATIEDISDTNEIISC